MGRTQRFIRGVGFGYAGQVLATLVGLWLTPFLLMRIGKHDYGLWLVGTQLILYVGLLDLGVVALLPRETAFATGRAGNVSDAKDLRPIVGQTARLVFWQTPIVAIAAAVVWFCLPADWSGLRQPIGVVLAAFVLTFPFRIFGALLQGLQDFSFLGKTNIVAFIISNAVTIALVLAGFGLYSLAFGWAALQMINAGANWYRLRTQFPGVLPTSLPKLRRDLALRQLKHGSWVNANQIAQVLLTGTDLLIIGKMFGPVAVVPYVCTAKLISVLAHQPQLLMQVAGPALSQMRAGDSRERLPQVCSALTQGMMIISGAVVCVVLAVNQGFVARWVGAEQFGGITLTALIVLGMLLRHWNLTVGITLFSFGYDRRRCLTSIVDGLVSVLSMTVLIWLFGLIGAPLGLMAGVILVSLPLNLSALAKETGQSVRMLVRPLLPWFARFAALLVIAGALAGVWIPQTWSGVAFTAVFSALVYVLVMFPLALRSPLGLYVRPRLVWISRKFFSRPAANEPRAIQSDVGSLVSIIVLSYRRPNLLKRALDSIAAQTYRNTETIVVDNWSDASVEIAEIVKAYPGVKLLANSRNLGFTGGMNRGLREASGKYVYLTEDDVILEATCITKLVDYLKNKPAIGLAAPIMHNDSDKTIRCAGGDLVLDTVYRRKVFAAGMKDNGQFREPFNVNFIPGASVFSRLELLRRLNGFREDFFMYSEDNELCLRVLKAGLKISIVPGAKVFHVDEVAAPANPVIEFHKLKNFFSLYLLHAPLRVLPEFYLRYGVINFLRAIASDRQIVWPMIKAWVWFVVNAPSFIKERYQSRVSEPRAVAKGSLCDLKETKVRFDPVATARGTDTACLRS